MGEYLVIVWVFVEPSRNRALSNILEPEEVESTGDRRKQHSEEFHDPYCSPDFVRVISHCTANRTHATK
jgi:hypothetical protein